MAARLRELIFNGKLGSGGANPGFNGAANRKRILNPPVADIGSGGLFGHGTHWEKITRRLEPPAGGPFSGAA
ncbi:MAG: hypothetical protein ACYDH9_21945 [Limisphaerales bacterium]